MEVIDSLVEFSTGPTVVPCICRDCFQSLTGGGALRMYYRVVTPLAWLRLWR